MQSILALFAGLPERSFAAGDIVLAEGDQTNKLYILVEGGIEILKGDVQVYTTAEPGALFGEVAALLSIPHTATVKTTSPCRAYVVEDAAAHLGAHPEITLWLSQLLAQRLHSVTSYLADLKAQFEDRSDHLGMVDEVLGTLLHTQDEAFSPGSDRYDDPRL
jgi:CRP/FNR family transcriptional regulator, cyclic AMP receptor protein